MYDGDTITIASKLPYLESPLYIFGDIHGQFSDMIHFLEMTGLPPNNKFLFLFL